MNPHGLIGYTTYCICWKPISRCFLLSLQPGTACLGACSNAGRTRDVIIVTMGIRWHCNIIDQDWLLGTAWKSLSPYQTVRKLVHKHYEDQVCGLQSYVFVTVIHGDILFNPPKKPSLIIVNWILLNWILKQISLFSIYESLFVTNAQLLKLSFKQNVDTEIFLCHQDHIHIYQVSHGSTLQIAMWYSTCHQCLINLPK